MAWINPWFPDVKRLFSTGGLLAALLPALVLLVVALGGGQPARQAESIGKVPVRVAVIGRMTLSGMWQALGERFTRETGWPVETVVSGPKDLLSAALRRGEVDLLTMHSSDQATNLVAEGYGLNLRPWARNAHMILGPMADPAGIRGGHDGAIALRQIARTRSPFVDFSGPGSRDVVHGLWKKAGIDNPRGDWLLKDESLTPQGILAYAAAHQAYVVVGQIPVVRGKMANPGGLEIMVQGDPAMRRPYVVLEANPARLPQTNAAGARALASWMLSGKGRAFLADFAGQQRAGFPLFYAPDDNGAPTRASADK